MQRNIRPLIGAHVSAAGGLYKAFEHACSLELETIQIFGASPRQWTARLPRKEEIERFQASWKESGVKTVFLHGAYLPNLASPDALIRKKSVQCLTDHFRITNALGATGLIFHIGSGKEMPVADAMDQVVSEIKIILQNVRGDSFLIMENAAGGGQKLGSSAQQMGVLMKQIDSTRVKICFDTAHAFEGGTISAYTPSNIQKLFDEWDTLVGLEHILALHANDSKTPFNSRNDRHENIGQGFIGLDGFKALAQEKRLLHTSWLLEVPGFDNLGPDKKNVDILKKCFQNEEQRYS